MPERDMTRQDMTDFDAQLADLLRRGLGGVAPTVDPERTARQAMTDRGAGRPWFRTLLGAAAVVLVVAIGAVFISANQPTGGRTETLHLSGYSLRHPADWTFHRVDFSPSFYSIPGYLASGPFASDGICGSIANGISCNEDAFTVAPASVVIKFKDWSPPFADQPAAEPGEEIMRVGDMPAFYSESRTGGDDGTALLRWRIRIPESISALLILEANVAGPGRGALVSQVQAMVDSLHWDNPPRELPQDPAAIARAVRSALASLAQDDHSYRCFPMPDETVEATVDNLPSSGLLRQALPVTCSTRVQEIETRAWQLTLLMSWATPEYAGSVTVNALVTVDGAVTSTWVHQDGDAPPMVGDGATPAPSPSGSPPTGIGRASWGLRLDADIGPQTTEFTAMVTERACAGGRSSEGRVIGPEIVYTADAVIVTFRVRALDGAQNCPSNPASAVLVRLDEPLGERRLLDGDTDPPSEPRVCGSEGYCD